MMVELVWVLYALLGTAFVSAFFLWAVRAGQFAHQERARYLPLVAAGIHGHEGHGEPEEQALFATKTTKSTEDTKET